MRQTFTAAILFITIHVSAQQFEKWTLQSSVQYALEHNISIRQNELNKRLAALSLKQSKLAKIPTLNANTSYGRSFGRSVDPTTNQFSNTDYDFLSASGTANVLLFGWFQQRNTIAANKFSLEAAKADIDQLKNDVSLNVATGFLRTLLAKEQININEKQVELSKAQLFQTRKFVDAGRLPELNAAQLESQLASDSSNLITAIANYKSAILDIKSLLNLDFETPYEIDMPEVNALDQLDLSVMNPEMIYEEAAKHFGTIKSSELKVLAAQKRIAAAKGALYPQLGFNAQFGTNFATSYKEVTNIKPAAGEPTGAYVPVNDSIFFLVYQPTYTYDTKTIPFSKQLNNNFRQTFSFGLNFPIFNAWQSQYNLKSAKITEQTQELNKYQATLKLKQDVYKAYDDAISAIQKYHAAERAAQAAQRAFDFAEKRYALGLTNTVEYLTTQNSQFVASSNLASAKYDLIFKLKVIDYYLGKELKL